MSNEYKLKSALHHLAKMIPGKRKSNRLTHIATEYGSLVERCIQAGVIFDDPSEADRIAQFIRDFAKDVEAARVFLMEELDEEASDK